MPVPGTAMNENPICSRRITIRRKGVDYDPRRAG